MRRPRYGPESSPAPLRKRRTTRPGFTMIEMSYHRHPWERPCPAGWRRPTRPPQSRPRADRHRSSDRPGDHHGRIGHKDANAPDRCDHPAIKQFRRFGYLVWHRTVTPCSRGKRARRRFVTASIQAGVKSQPASAVRLRPLCLRLAVGYRAYCAPVEGIRAGASALSGASAHAVADDGCPLSRDGWG